MMDPVTLAMLLALSGTGGQAASGTMVSTGGQAVSDTAATKPATASQPALKVKPGDRLVAMGDSITQAGGYLRVIQAVFTQQYPDLELPPIVNVGIGGQRAEDMVERFEKDVLAKKPDIVTISVGINDVWHRMDQPHDPKVLEQYGRNVERMVRMAREAGARVLLLSPTVIEEDPASEGNRRLAQYIEAGKQIARKHGVDYVDLHDIFLRVVEKRRNLPLSERGEALTTDGVHMTPTGDTLMAVGVLRALGVPDEKIRATDLSKVFGKD